MRRLLLLAACLSAGRAAAAQDRPERHGPPASFFHLYVSADVAIARRQAQPWDAIHEALNNSGWDAFYPTSRCQPFCATASEVATGYPLGVTLAVRARARGSFGLRAFAGLARLGAYPGANLGTALSIRPTAGVVGAQGVLSWRSIWVALGPTLNFDRVEELGGTARQKASGTRVGGALGLGAAFRAPGRLFVEVVLERRLAGSIDVPPLAVPAAPVVPAMRVPLDHTLLAIGIGVRR